MPSPLRHPEHSRPHFQFNTWAGTYVAATPITDGGDNATILLDYETEVQPDVFIRLEGADAQSAVNEEGYITGAPELIIEIAASSVAYDLHVKKRAYARHHVREYIAVQIYDQRIDWFILREGGYETVQSGEDGILRSEVFPGLWLDPKAFWAGDLAGMLAVLQGGLASPEHRTFLESLK